MGNDETLSHCTSRVQGEDGADIPHPLARTPCPAPVCLLCSQKMQMCLFSDGSLSSLQNTADCFNNKHEKKKKKGSSITIPFSSYHNLFRSLIASSRGNFAISFTESPCWKKKKIVKNNSKRDVKRLHGQVL